MLQSCFWQEKGLQMGPGGEATVLKGSCATMQTVLVSGVTMALPNSVGGGSSCRKTCFHQV